MILQRRGDERAAERTPNGWAVDAEHEWVAHADATALDSLCLALGSAAQRLAPNMALLSFGNAVGRYSLGAEGWLDVRSGKWEEHHYQAMLADITEWSAALPFHAGAPSALPYSRSEVDAPDVLYHAFVWLRHALLEGSSPLLGGLHAVLADPHRRMVADERLVAAELASRVSARALDEIAAGLRPLLRVQAGRGIAGSSFFPIEITEQVSRASVDTAENRFVKAFLESCSFIVEAMRRRVGGRGAALAIRVCGDCDAMDGLLAQVQRHRLWADVGRMTMFPASSTVLQRRSAYREILRHHVLMRMASKALPLDATEVEQLLEVKDIARLYELWAAFAVIDAVHHVNGPPVHAERAHDDGLSAKVGSGILARWADGTEVVYNQTFTQASGFRGARSRSLRFRPDVAIWIPTGASQGLHFLDAKFRLDGSIADGEAEDSSFKHGDVHKMHAYRDAIPAARSAWVLYPGMESAAYLDDGPQGVSGVGAISLCPGGDNPRLRALLADMLGGRDRPIPGVVEAGASSPVAAQ